MLFSTNKKLLLLFALIFIFSQNLFSQVGSEFPIEVGPDSTFATGYAQDDVKYAIVMRKEKGLNGADIVVQFHSRSDHSLIGGLITVGSTVVPSHMFDEALPQIAFDGTRYLVVWSDISNGGIKYRFIHSQTFELSQLYSDSTLPVLLGGNCLHYNSVTNKYLLVSGIKTQSGVYLVYNFISTNGYLSNSSQRVNFAARKEVSLSYALGKYFICFIKEDPQYSDHDVYGQILNEDGSLSGSPFAIDINQFPSDNPIFVTFDGKYFVCFFPDEEPSGWKLYARRIAPNGAVSNERFFISDDFSFVPFAAVGNGKILVTWIKLPIGGMGYLKGRFFDSNLTGIGNEFVFFYPLDNKFPLGNTVVFNGQKFLCYTTLVKFGIAPDSSIYFFDGDIYGTTIIDPTLVEEETDNPDEYILYQNYPNPFNPSTKIKFYLKENGFTTLKIFNLMSQEIVTIISDYLSSGNHEIVLDASRFGLNSGVYFAQLNAGSYKSTIKLVYLK